MSEVSLDFLSRKFDQLIDQQRQLRDDMRQVLENQVLAQRTVTNLDRRLSDVKDELELTIKMEIGGRLANAETRIEGQTKEYNELVWKVLARVFADKSITSFEEFHRAGKEAVERELQLLETR